MRGWLLGLVGIGAGGGLAWVALRSVVWGKVLQGFTDLDPRILVLALGAVLFAGLLEAYRWKLLLPRERVSTARLFLVKNTGNGLNNISPIRVLAEVAQTTMLRYGNGIGVDKVVSSLVVSRLFDLLVTVNLVGAGLIVLPQLAGLKPMVLPLWGLVSAALLAFLVLGRWMHRIPLVHRFSALEGVLRSMAAVAGNPGVMLRCAVLTATAWMSIGVAAWLVARTAGIDLPFWLMAIVIVAVTLFSGVVPAPPGAIGVYEFGIISTLGLFAVDPAVALTFALVIHGILFLPATLIGIVVLAGERRTMERTLAALVGVLRPARHEAGT